MGAESVLGPGGATSSAMSMTLGLAGAPPPRDATATVAVTAEIPIVPNAPAQVLPDGSLWVAGTSTRLPAPVLLRQLVWSLVIVLVLAGFGLWVLRYRPSWLAFARQEAAPAAATATAGDGTHPHTSGVGRARSGSIGGFHVLSSTPASAGKITTYTYSVGSSAYSVDVATTNRTWVVMRTPSDAPGVPPVFAVEPPGWSHTMTALSGTFFVEVAARGATITVRSGNKVVGTIADAPSAGYTFQS